MSTVFASFFLSIQSRGAIGVCALLAALGTSLGGCEEKKPAQEERIEPWRRDATEEGAAEHAKLTRYEVQPDQTLELSLPGRKGKPTGVLRGISGEIDVALRQLTKTNGTVRIDLSRLSMEQPEAVKKTKAKPDPDEDESPMPDSAGAATTLALNWLGLGSATSPQEKTKNRSAVFEISHLRDLSHPSAHTGAARTPEGDSSARTRQVYATAEGDLSLRGYSVTRQIAVTLHFHYPDKADGELVPEAIDVTLRPTFRVPLSEYRIEPRDEAGNVLSEQQDLLGRQVGSQATITGKIRLRRAGSSQTPASRDTLSP